MSSESRTVVQGLVWAMPECKCSFFCWCLPLVVVPTALIIKLHQVYLPPNITIIIFFSLIFCQDDFGFHILFDKDWLVRIGQILIVLRKTFSIKAEILMLEFNLY